MIEKTDNDIRGADNANITEDKRLISGEHIELTPDTPPSWRRREKFGKRSNFEIRLKILQSLEIYPQTLEELCNSCKAHRSTIQSHITWLEAVGKVQKMNLPYNGKVFEIWKLNK